MLLYDTQESSHHEEKIFILFLYALNLYRDVGQLFLN